MIKKSKTIKTLEETAEQKFNRFLKGDTRSESFVYTDIPKHVVLAKVAEIYNETYGSLRQPKIFDYVVWHRREESNAQEFYHIEKRKTTKELYLVYLKKTLTAYIAGLNGFIEHEEKTWWFMRNNTAIQIWKDVVESHQKSINDIDAGKCDAYHFKAVDTKVEYILDVYFYDN